MAEKTGHYFRITRIIMIFYTLIFEVFLNGTIKCNDDTFML